MEKGKSEKRKGGESTHHNKILAKTLQTAKQLQLVDSTTNTLSTLKDRLKVFSRSFNDSKCNRGRDQA